MIEFGAYLKNDTEPQAEWNPDLSGAFAVPRIPLTVLVSMTPNGSGSLTRKHPEAN